MAFLQLQWWWCWWWWVGCPTIKQNFFDYFMLTAAASRSHLVFGFGHKVIAGPALKKKATTQARGAGKWPTNRQMSVHGLPCGDFRSTQPHILEALWSWVAKNCIWSFFWVPSEAQQYPVQWKIHNTHIESSCKQDIKMKLKLKLRRKLYL